MAKLRSAANWAFLRPQRIGLRNHLFQRIRWYLRQADPQSLAGAMDRIPVTPLTAPEHQVPQWLFAFDPAGMSVFRSLGLLASHPGQQAMARNEAATDPGRMAFPFLHATVLESLRLWPTSPLILRETTATEWKTGVLPAGTGVVIFSPYFHRDNERLSFADAFSPELWTEGKSPESLGIIPFSEGAAACPGRHLVLLLTTVMIAALLEDSPIRMKRATRLDPRQPMPGTLNPYGLRFASV